MKQARLFGGWPGFSADKPGEKAYRCRGTRLARISFANWSA